MQPIVSIVILNWNGIFFIGKCMEGVQSQSYSNVECILVDNASSDGSPEFVLEKFPNVILIRNEDNLGFAEGMNIGIAAASGKYVMTLNMDVFLRPDCVASLLIALEADDKLGAVMGKELIWDDHGFRNEPSISSGPGYLRKRCQGTRDRALLDKQVRCFGAMGSFPVFRSECLSKLCDNVGYAFDPKFGTGWEDKDIFFRIHHLGYRFLYEPLARAYHFGSGSVGGKLLLLDKPLDYQIRIFRNRYFFILKNYPAWLILRHIFYLAIAEVGTIFYILCKRPQSLKALFFGQIAAFGGIHSILQDRKLILSKSVLTHDEMLGFFKGF